MGKRITLGSLASGSFLAIYHSRRWVFFYIKRAIKKEKRVWQNAQVEKNLAGM